MNNECKANPIIKMIVFFVFFCIYIFPTGLLGQNYTYSKFIFVFSVCFCYLFSFKQMKIRELIYIFTILLLTIISKNINYMIFITIPYLDKLLQKKNEIISYILSSKILYICLFFTLLYSIIFAGTDGRYSFTAIKEINQSGLAIFCLGLLLRKKNKKLGIFALLFGLLTFSRSYYLSIILYFLSKTKFIRKILSKEKLIKFWTYNKLTIVSSIILILFGFFYIEQYKTGNITTNVNVSNKLFNFLDFSNFFRFTSVINIIMLFKNYPLKLLFGVTDSEYISMGVNVAMELGIPYKYVVPHNLFYSHLKIYGLFSIIETIYVSKLLENIVNKYNFIIFITIVLYSVILGAGLYNYWLYLSIFILIIYHNNDSEKGEMK